MVLIESVGPERHPLGEIGGRHIAGHDLRRLRDQRKLGRARGRDLGVKLAAELARRHRVEFVRRPRAHQDHALISTVSRGQQLHELPALAGESRRLDGAAEGTAQRLVERLSLLLEHVTLEAEEGDSPRFGQREPGKTNMHDETFQDGRDGGDVLR